MDGWQYAVRRTALIAIAAASMLGGLVLVWNLLRPGVFSVVPTAQLLMLLGLFVLPAATVGAWSFDRSAARRERERRQANQRQRAAGLALREPVLVESCTGAPPARVQGHDPGQAERRSDTHRRRRAGQTQDV